MFFMYTKSLLLRVSQSVGQSNKAVSKSLSNHTVDYSDELIVMNQPPCFLD